MGSRVDNDPIEPVLTKPVQMMFEPGSLTGDHDRRPRGAGISPAGRTDLRIEINQSNTAPHATGGLDGKIHRQSRLAGTSFLGKDSKDFHSNPHIRIIEQSRQ